MSDTTNRIKIKAVLERIRYYKDESSWGIIDCSVEEVMSGHPSTNPSGRICCKGIMPEPIPGKTYLLVGNEVDDKQYGRQYEISYMASLNSAELENKIEQKKFLQTIYTAKQVENMYKVYENPYEVFLEADYSKLVKIKGCGVANAEYWLRKFNENLYMAKIYIELEQYDLTVNMVKKLLDTYNAPELIIQKVKANPYILAELDGVGFITADKYAMNGGISPTSMIRVKAFLIYYLEQMAEQGYSYVHPDDLLDAIINTLGEDIPNLVIADSIHDLSDRLWWNDDKSQIGLKRLYELEKNLAVELLRIRNAKSNFEYNGWEEVVKQQEEIQGWEHTEEQIEAVKLCLQENICVIHGGAGTGKSSSVQAVVNILKRYLIAQCALAGRASARLAEVTGLESHTIHRLLGYPDPTKAGKNGYVFYEDNPIPYDIIIVDEISMIDGYLFYYLLRAVKSGSKVILLGDIGQLESIGTCNVASDIIASSSIPTCYLSKIHRQAAKSAVITESIKIRNGISPIKDGWAGVEVRGELQDLTLDCYSDRNQTYFKVLQYFSECLSVNTNILEIQTIVPVKERGSACTWNLNNAMQELYNPKSKDKAEIAIVYAKDKVGIVRVGDKVINMKNSKNLIDIETEKQTPVFNGNVGIVVDINEKEQYIIVDFQYIGKILIPKDKLKFIELAYAITVHKSQGSGYGRVIFAFDFSSYSMLTKELVYTGVTRAKQHCYLVAETNALLYAISKNGVQNKLTHLQRLLAELDVPAEQKKVSAFGW